MSPKGLEDALYDVFASYPGAEASALKMAAAYYDYAAPATFGILNKAIVTPIRAAPLAAMLGAVVLVPAVATPVMFASAWGMGVAAFWPGILVVGPLSGVVTECPSAAKLIPTLMTLMMSNPPTIRSLARDMSLLIHTVSISTLSLLTTPPPVPVPVIVKVD